MSKDKEILAHLAQGESQRHIVAALHVSRNTVAKVAAAAKHLSLSPAEWKDLAEPELHQKLFPASASEPAPVMPDFCYIHRELLRSGVTLKLLWEEYVDSCRQSHQLYFRYSQFCKRYRDHVEQNNLTMHIRHKPGDRIMVDWVSRGTRSAATLRPLGRQSFPPVGREDWSCYQESHRGAPTRLRGRGAGIQILHRHAKAG